jgi:hypothetical protein
VNVKLLTTPALQTTEAMSQAHETRLPCSKETRRLVKQQKRGGEPYDSVLRKMVRQYDPEEAAERAENKV